MIELIVGDYEKTQPIVAEKVASFRARGLVINVLEQDDFLKKDFELVVPRSKNLFGEAEVFVLKNTLELIDLPTLLPLYSDTENILLFVEEKINKKTKELFENNTIPIFKYEEKKTKSKNTFNIFSLADAFGARDKKTLWLKYREALDHASVEEIHGVLFWQLKNIASVKWDKGKGLKPFVLKKNRSYAERFSDQDIHNLSHRFLRIFHERKSLSTLEIELEKLILSL